MRLFDYSNLFKIWLEGIDSCKATAREYKILKSHEAQGRENKTCQYNLLSSVMSLNIIEDAITWYHL